MLKVLRFRDVWSKCQPTRMLAQQMNRDMEADLKKRMENMPRVKPPGQPPKVWQQLEKVSKDGKAMKFTIQEIPENRYEDALEHMCAHFLADEPTCECLNSKDDPVFVNDISMLWRIIFRQNIAIAAFIENPAGGKPIIAGMNALGVALKDHKDSIASYQFKSETCKNTFDLIGNATKVVYEHYGVDKYLYAIGLSVTPEYRGYGLGTDLLKLRNEISREYGIPATATVFTSVFSQKSAAKAGLEPFVYKNFADLVDKNGKEYFPGIKSKEFIVMGKKFSS